MIIRDVVYEDIDNIAKLYIYQVGRKLIKDCCLKII